MFHLPPDTCFPLRGTCQHRSHCHRTFRVLSCPGTAHLCLRMRCDIPPMLGGWCVHSLLISSSSPTSSALSQGRGPVWGYGHRSRPPAVDTYLPSRPLVSWPHWKQVPLHSRFPGQAGILASENRKKMDLQET